MTTNYFFSKPAHVVLANAILASAKAYELSYDKEAVKAAEDAWEHDAKVTIDYYSFYRLSIQQACDQNSPTDLARIVYLLLEDNWNDAIAWAESIFGIKETIDHLIAEEGLSDDKHLTPNQRLDPARLGNTDAPLPKSRPFERPPIVPWTPTDKD